METNIDQSVGTIVKSDQTGRTRYTPEYKREVNRVSPRMVTFLA
jgi:hypothetical protein